MGRLWNGLKNFGRKIIGGVKKLIPKAIGVTKKVGDFVSKGGMDDALNKAGKAWQTVKPLLPEKGQQTGEGIRRKIINLTDKGRYLVSKLDNPHILGG